MKKLYDYAIGTRVSVTPSDEPDAVYWGSIEEDTSLNRYIHFDDGTCLYPDSTDVVNF